MKIERVIQHFNNAPDCFICPKCKQPVSQTEKSFICENRHCYDLSNKKYVNFAPSAKPTKYTADLFEARSAVLSGGFYTPVSDAILKMIKDADQRQTILDAGCGEGYYSGQIKARCPEADLFAMDLSKEAVISAARHYPELFAMVADLAHIPFKDHSVDILLNILTPANYQEFFRVLKPDGRLIKVIPGKDYLKEIRQALGEQIMNSSFSNEQVLTHIETHTRVIDHQTVHYTRPVTSEERQHFITMTPMTFNLEDKTTFNPDFESITIHLDLLVCQNPTP